MIELTNGMIRIGIDEEDGAVRLLRCEERGIDYIASGAFGGEPFRLETDDGTSGAFESFAYEVEKSAEMQSVSLRWKTASGVVVKGRIALSAAEPAIEFRCEAENGSPQRLLGLEYPIIPYLQSISEQGQDDYVAHSFATGFKVRHPMSHFEPDGKGLRYMPYPESFSGASMQFFTYYGLNRGGLYFAALDGEGYAKWLNFYKGRSGLLEASFIHGCEDMGPGKGIEVPYPVVIRTLEGRDWYEAADLYKSWAERQAWCAQGPVEERAKRESFQWLYEQMGAATFGINAGHDRTAWLRQYHEHIRTPMFHMLGPDWTNAPQTFYKGVPGGFDDWFPTRFNADNIACMKEYGDRFAPFEFDCLYHFEGADGEKGKEARQVFPEHIKSVDAYRFPFICPAHPYTKEFHVRRDETLQRSDNVDAIYYDISANNIMKICMDDSHGHAVGAGRAIGEAYRDNYERTKRAMSAQAGRYVPMGTEMMNETLLGVLDYYQARAGAQPCAPLEGWPIRDLLKSGEAELIPMFAYVYHEYGALRMDGWGKLVEEIGTLFYYTVARTYLWGGLYELNYEYSPMEALDGTENRPEEHYYPFEPRGYAFSEERARYLSLFARLRIGAGNRYLAYGRMLRPVPMECARVNLRWFHYNHGINSGEYNDSGELAVDAVVQAAWQYRNESVALFFANVSDEEQRVKAALDEIAASVPDWEGRIVSCRLLTQGEREERSELGIDEAMEAVFDIPPRSAVMLELA